MAAPVPCPLIYFLVFHGLWCKDFDGRHEIGTNLKFLAGPDAPRSFKSTKVALHRLHACNSKLLAAVRMYTVVDSFSICFNMTPTKLGKTAICASV
ncbi:hypothetical protein GALMADRAFT_237979 [Galerina marginata CBS 339.88]|uniref:Uncharacterized protein n=1 Tax=Galerina marginata (strain CBS 339.88) TaxID=685588 RepID=A0A067THH4_GALM3|nr:hypothetical protein GALMADRAFT_237979 [Galerina marginata CBS 339.88]